MTDAPERIITALEVGQAKRRIIDPSETQPMTLSDVVQYRRDDLPPTLAEALTVPEVRALVEALEGMIDGYQEWEIPRDAPSKTARLRPPELQSSWVQRAYAALAKLTEGGEG